jgi:hypothetical protein
VKTEEKKRVMGRGKGSSFERKVAGDVVTHFKVDKKSCYRTPLSGGHPYAGKGDLVVAPALFPKFPFCTECKHQKWVNIGCFVEQNERVLKFFDQVLKATRESEYPLLIARGNNTSTFALIRVKDTRKLFRKDWRQLIKVYGVIHTDKYGSWRWFKWPQFLSLLKSSPST